MKGRIVNIEKHQNREVYIKQGIRVQLNINMIIILVIMVHMLPAGNI